MRVIVRAGSALCAACARRCHGRCTNEDVLAGGKRSRWALAKVEPQLGRLSMPTLVAGAFG